MRDLAGIEADITAWAQVSVRHPTHRALERPSKPPPEPDHGETAGEPTERAFSTLTGRQASNAL